MFHILLRNNHSAYHTTTDRSSILWSIYNSFFFTIIIIILYNVYNITLMLFQIIATPNRRAFVNKTVFATLIFRVYVNLFYFRFLPLRPFDVKLGFHAWIAVVSCFASNENGSVIEANTAVNVEKVGTLLTSLFDKIAHFHRAVAECTC